MSIILLIAVAVALWLLLWVWSHKGHRAIARGLRTIGTLNAVISAYREGDYETALQKTDDLKPGISKTAEYCFFRGSMLHHLGRFDEAEASLREGLPLEENPSQKALVYNTLASVFMDQGRYPEAIATGEHREQASAVFTGVGFAALLGLWVRRHRGGR